MKLILHVRAGGLIDTAPYRIDSKKISKVRSVANVDYFSEERIAAISEAIDEYERYVGLKSHHNEKR